MGTTKKPESKSRNGYQSMNFSSKTINAGNNAKTVKGDGEYLTAIMYLAPHKLSGVGNLCPMADLAGCTNACLNTAGRGRFNKIQNARIRKSKWFLENQTSFMEQLDKDLKRFEKRCKDWEVKPVVRLNGTSDIRWENIKTINEYPNIFDAYPNIQFYDYTKIPNRKVSGIKNYNLTWSYSEANQKYKSYVAEAKRANMNIAVVFRNEFPRKFLNLPVIDGDKDDLRFLDPKGSIVGLKAKGAAKKDNSGFVVDN